MSGIIILLIKTNYEEKSLDLADFALQEQPEHCLIVAISRTCLVYHGRLANQIIPGIALYNYPVFNNYG